MADNELFTRHWTKAQPVVAGYISSLVPDFLEAEDLLQEVAVVLLRKFDDYDPGRPFVAWALGIAKLEVLSNRRSHARSFLSYRPDVLETVTEVCAEMAPELEFRASALRECLKQVRGRDGELVKLRYEESLKPGEIAARLGMAAGTVRVVLSRIRASLQECIERKLARYRK
jgi:RNA polymerase sigma-70 factor (ECF subfamily)